MALFYTMVEEDDYSAFADDVHLNLSVRVGQEDHGSRCQG